MNIKQLSMSAAALSLALSTACGQGDVSELGAGESAGDAAKTVQIAGAHGNPRSVTVMESEVSAAGSYAEVRIGERSFELEQWIDADSGALHDVVSSTDGAVRYEAVIGASGSHLVLTDAAGQRTIEPDESIGSLDADAAALLASFRAPASDGETPYYRTYCVGYDTSNPDDYHLVVGGCTCAHWYSILCTMD